MLLFPKQSVTSPCPIHRAFVFRDEWARHKSLRLLAALALFLPLTARAGDKPRPAPPVKPAAEYPANDPHPNEKVTIAADPCDDEDHCKFFRLPYVQHGFLPVRVIITNDRDQPLDLTEVRIQFFPAEGAKQAAATDDDLTEVRIQFFPAEGAKQAAATDDDLNRRLFHGKDATGTKLPIIPITIHHQPVDQKILNDDTDFGFTSMTVPAHSTRAGYVFYDTRGIDEPVMKHAELYVKEIYSTDEKGAKVQLFAFAMPFDKFLAANPQSGK